jgi:hypothetical protein
MWRYLGAPMTNTLSFRKESIQRSSSVSESLGHALEAQGVRAANDQRPISLTTWLTRD